MEEEQLATSKLIVLDGHDHITPRGGQHCTFGSSRPRRLRRCPWHRSDMVAPARPKRARPESRTPRRRPGRGRRVLSVLAPLRFPKAPRPRRFGSTMPRLPRLASRDVLCLHVYLCGRTCCACSMASCHAPFLLSQTGASRSAAGLPSGQLGPILVDSQCSFAWDDVFGPDQVRQIVGNPLWGRGWPDAPAAFGVFPVGAGAGPLPLIAHAGRSTEAMGQPCVPSWCARSIRSPRGETLRLRDGVACVALRSVSGALVALARGGLRHSGTSRCERAAAERLPARGELRQQHRRLVRGADRATGSVCPIAAIISLQYCGLPRVVSRRSATFTRSRTL